MSKGQIFIVATSGIILVSFGALCYLMTIVNPKPLKTSPEETRRYSSVDTLYVNDFFLPSDNVEYGLEKVPEGYAEMINITQYPVTRIMPYVQGPPGTITKRVMPPVFPKINYTNIKNNFTRSNNETNAYYSNRGQRRSIRDQNDIGNHINNPSALILKIVDEDGIQKIEIKVGSKSMNKKKARKYRSSSHKTNSQHSRRNKTNLANQNDTEDIVILASNDTIVLNIIGDSVILSGANKVKIVDSDDNIKTDNATRNDTASFRNDMGGDANNSLDEKENFRMFDLLKVKEENSVNKSVVNIDEHLNETGILSVNSKNLTNNILNYEVDDKNSKSVRRGVKDVKNNNSVVDLLILEDSLRGALINENEPFVLNENTFNSTELR
ncbi:putative uncharacterized protein DDB_G0293878 [Colias croceus]|uniref:putative uncharacterized protein DDB_G0293878 n=1 Tax=Colias crocea TaxID=72248 RepID=UPI001E27CBB2|nr:putative uncharacterized protein DDB_G0293878 [Colias croceus]